MVPMPGFRYPEGLQDGVKMLVRPFQSSRWMVAALVTLMATPAQAAPVKFGFTGVHQLDSSAWSSMNDEGRGLFLASRADLAKRMGASIIRLGAARPWLVDMENIHAGNQRKWTDADAAVKALNGSGLELCLTIPELIEPSGMSAYQDYLSRLAERYDGDTDFGIDPADVNYEFPDIDGSGALTIADWEASDEAIGAWAEAHRVSRLEAGHEPRALEMTGQLPEDAYAQQLKVARASVNGAQSDLDLVLAGVRLDDQSKSHFVNRFDALSSSTAPWFDLAVAHLFESSADISLLESATHLSKFGNWLASIDHGSAPRWLGELALPAVASPNGQSPFSDERTSDRTQSNGLLRLTIEALLEGYEAILYAIPVEVETSDGGGVRAGTGLLRMTEIPGLEPTQWPYEARPAYAMWRWLTDRFTGIDSADLSRLSGLPVNARGARVSGQGWVLWYDWFVEVAPGADYEGAQKPVTLNGVPSSSVRVITLWPSSVATQVAEDGSVEATWTEELLPVEGGSVTIMMGRDPVWVEESDELVTVDEPPIADAGPIDTVNASMDTSTGGASPESSGGGSNEGCQGGHSPDGSVWLLIAGLALWSRLRRTTALCA